VQSQHNNKSDMGWDGEESTGKGGSQPQHGPNQPGEGGQLEVIVLTRVMTLQKEKDNEGGLNQTGEMGVSYLGGHSHKERKNSRRGQLHGHL